MIIKLYKRLVNKILVIKNILFTTFRHQRISERKFIQFKHFKNNFLAFMISKQKIDLIHK